ncbi:hypothetical protein [Tenacibaculum finnmarkense]|uniref:hypothetical protein n=1 Tax=Tenacibaculum finnmarkense TaxID=2781243 RepID=UPI003BB7040C
MKKIFLLVAVFAMVFTSCEPLEDINAEIDAQENAIVADVEYTLEDADYTNKITKGGLGFKYPNFNSEADAKAELPAFLANKYPVFGKKSSAVVTFKVYSKKNNEKSLESYEVTKADYTEAGQKYGNFSKFSHITDFLNGKYTNPANRLLVSLTYKYYSGSVSTLNNGFLFNNGAWELVTGFSKEEYKQMGESHPNFSSKDEAYAKIPVFLLDKYKYEPKEAGTVQGFMYNIHLGKGVTDSFVIYFIYDGNNWAKYTNTVEQTVKFGHDGTNWVPDNTIKYTLTGADYALIGNDRYNNFDVRAGKDDETEAVRLDKINTILLNNFPTDLEGQKYIVSYSVYDGANKVFTMKLVKQGAVYVIQKEEA